MKIKKEQTFLQGLFEFINQPGQKKKFAEQSQIEGKTEEEIIHEFIMSSCREFLELLDKKPHLN